MSQRTPRWLHLGGISVLLLAAVLAACVERRPQRFPHRVHLTEIECGAPGKPECLSCNTCHQPSQKDRAHKLPEAGLCENCHKADAHQVLPVLAVDPPRPYGDIAFDHDLHLQMDSIGGQCVACHAGVVRAGVSTTPPMSQCFTCHEHQAEWERGVCSPCHQQKDLARILPETFLRHDQAFVRHHGSDALMQGELCAACHSQSECQACHDLSQSISVERRRPERIESSFVHRGDFMVRHAIEARNRPQECLSCHTPSTCDGCHALNGVSGNSRNARNPHPPGWVGTAPDARSSHGREARRDILACAGCHDQGPATNCIRCHKVGAYGGNPHPNGWQSSQSSTSGMCRYCHE